MTKPTYEELETLNEQLFDQVTDLSAQLYHANSGRLEDLRNNSQAITAASQALWKHHNGVADEAEAVLASPPPDEFDCCVKVVLSAAYKVNFKENPHD